MSGKIFAVVLVFLCFAPIALVQASSTNGEAAATLLSSSGHATRSLTPHDPISINGNDQFTPENGVSAGNGSADNPYVIENWDIDASSGNGVEIRNTDVFFIIKNCIVSNGYGYNYDGIYFYCVSNGTIVNTTLYNNYHGIFFEQSSYNFIIDCDIDYTFFNGIVLSTSSNNTLLNCTTQSTSHGASNPTNYEDDLGAGSITLKHSSNNNIVTNCTSTTGYYNLYDGIFITNRSNSNLITDCVVFGFFNGGGVLLRYSSCNNRVVNCTSYGNNFNYLIRQSSNNNTIENCLSHSTIFTFEVPGYGGFVFWDGLASNNTIINCTSYNDTKGIWMTPMWGDVQYNNIINFTTYNDGVGVYLTVCASYTNIVNCKLYNSSYFGVRLMESSNNSITDCTIYNASQYGIRLEYDTLFSDNNLIYHNNFINNTNNADDECTNYWDYNGEGNYWSDYTGVDANGDGIGDDPYYISGGSNRDNYPLMFPYPIRRNLAVQEHPKFENSAAGVKISCNVSNTEQMDLSSVTVNFSANNVLISSQKTELPKNSTKTVTAAWQPESGSYYVRVEIDPEKAIGEINEYDNVKEIGIDVFDFSIQKLTIPEKLTGGYEINATIYTEGPSTVYANVSVFINGTFYASQIPRLLPGNNTTVAFPWNPSTGDYSIIVKANANLFLYESNIANNERYIEAKIQKNLPDLSITSSDIYFSKDLPDEEENITITALIENSGYLQSQEAKVKFYDNDVPFSEQSLQPVSPGEQQPISTFWIAREGHAVKVAVDTLGAQEFNPNNNQATRYLTTTKKCDLAIGNITTDPSVPYEGKPAIIYAEIFNLGNATGEGVVSFYEMGALIGNTSTGIIQHGSLTKVSVSWPSARSWRTITVRVVSLKKEKDMTNNEGYKSIEETIIGPKQDLTITAVYFDPSTPIYNETCRICVNLTNLGNATSVSALLTFYEGTNLIGNATISPMLPGGNDSCSINWIGKKGVTIYVTILAIEEDDIVNNAKSVYVSYIARPDIAVENIRFSKELPVENETITIYADLRNIGDAPSKETNIKFYANNILIEQKQLSGLQQNQTSSLYVLWNAKAKTIIKVVVEYEDTSAANNIAEKMLLETTNPVGQPSLILPEAVTGVASLIALFAVLVVYAKRYAVVGIVGQTIRYKWLDKEKVLKEEPRKSVYKFIFNNPRRSITSMAKELGMPKSALRYHLDVLEYFGHLRAMHTGYAKIYWPALEPLSGTLAIRERKITLTIASEPTPFEKIVSNITESGESAEKIAEETEYILRSMQERGLVETKYFGNTKYYSYTFPREAI